MPGRLAAMGLAAAYPRPGCASSALVADAVHYPLTVRLPRVRRRRR